MYKYDENAKTIKDISAQYTNPRLIFEDGTWVKMENNRAMLCSGSTELSDISDYFTYIETFDMNTNRYYSLNNDIMYIVTSSNSASVYGTAYILKRKENNTFELLSFQLSNMYILMHSSNYDMCLCTEKIYTIIPINTYLSSLEINGKIYNSEYGGNTSSEDLLVRKQAYVNGQLINGAMSDNGDVTIAPTTSEQVKEKGYYNSLKVSAVTSAIDPNITPENIKKDISILGVEGTLEGGIDTSDANATANDIVKNKTAYANNEKITGVISEVKADGSIGGSYSGPRYDDSTNTIYIEYNEDVDTYYFKYDINNDTVLREGAKINYQMRRSGLKDYFEVSTEKIKSGEQIMGVTGSFDIEYMPNGFGDNDTTYYVEGDSSYIKDQEILVPYYDTDGSINKNFAIVGNYAILNYRQMNGVTVENTGYILTEVLSDIEIGTDTTLAVKLKIKEILLPEHIPNTESNFE